MKSWSDVFRRLAGGLPGCVLVLAASAAAAAAEEPRPQPQPPAQSAARPKDAVQEFQTPRAVPAARPEQRKTQHDLAPALLPINVPPSSPALDNQPERG